MVATSHKLKKAKVASRTDLKSYGPFLTELQEKYPTMGPVVMGGHAVNYWIEHYRDRFSEPEKFRTLLGKDIDCILHPKVVAKEFVNNEDVYNPPAVFLFDLFFLAVRRFILRQRFTPFAPWFIVRLGKVNVPLPGSKKIIHADFFAHSVGYHPDYVRKRAVPVSLDGVAAPTLLMDPIQCLWQFIANAAWLNQTRGDSGPRRRTDHYRTMLLGPIAREYLADLAAGVPTGPGNDPAATLAMALDDFASWLKRKETRLVGQQLGIDWALALPETEAFAKATASGKAARLVETIRKRAAAKPMSDLELKARKKDATPGTLDKLPAEVLTRVEA